MSLRLRDVRILFHAGFTRAEIALLGAATDPKGNPQPPIDLQSPAWLAALANRRAWSDRIQAQWIIDHNEIITRRLYNRIIDQWYQKGVGRSPWDWLKVTYQPKKKVDFITAAKRRARAQARSLGKEFKGRG